MNNEPWSKIILLASRLQLSDEEVRDLNELIAPINDWDKVVEMVIARQAGPLLYQKILLQEKTLLIPAKALDALRQSQLKTLSRNMVLAAHFAQIATALNNEGIPVIAMKGIYLLEWLYKDASLRQCSDIDLLVKPVDGERALELMRKLGYLSVQTGLPADITQKLMPVHYLPMIKNGVSVEIHTRLHSAVTEYEIDMETLWTESVVIKLHGVMTRVFRPEHLLITLIQHLDKHFSKSKFQFTGFYDISNLLDIYGETMDISIILSSAETWRLKTMVQEYCTMVHQYFKGSVPYSLLIQQAPKKLEDILSKSLTDKVIKSTYSLTNYKSIWYFDSIPDRMNYVLRLTFPPSIYLMQRYHFKNKMLMLYYYPYRFLTLIKTAVIVVWRKTLKL